MLGLGKMGAPMARHLIAKGYSVSGYDPHEPARRAATAHGVAVGDSARAVATASELVIIVVGFDHQVETVMYGPQGVNANVRIWPNKEVEPGAVVHESIIWAGSWKRGLFSSYGLTGLINIEITPEFASRLGAAIGALTPKGTEIAFSRDYTRSARMIGRALMSGIISSGSNVIDLSVLPAPAKSARWSIT